MKRDSQDLLAGALLIAIGVSFAIYAQGYGVGTLRRIEPGLFPTALGVIMAGLGLILFVPALFRPGQLPPVEWRTGACILGSFIVFAIALRPLGLALTAFITVIIASLADRQTGWGQRLLLAAAISLVTVVIFRVGLGLPVQTLWR